MKKPVSSSPNPGDLTGSYPLEPKDQLPVRQNQTHHGTVDHISQKLYGFLMLRPIDRGIVPQGGRCIYVDPDDGWRFEHRYYDHVKNCARDHRIKMGKEIPYDWDRWYDEQYCKSCPQACHEIPDGNAEKSPSWLAMAASFTRSMIQWALSGFKVVTYEEFKRRYSICAGSPPEGDNPATPQCVHFGTFPIFGMTRCQKCGCSSKKIWIASEHCPINKW